ncbi:PrgI family protein [Paenibacillus sp. DYY-L-2]|uniref:PrgI family protein n=1 Tax=Paenibacillus sp. DYY-L-2 TaxID=3447013 RepID=UPI003F500093
MAIEVRIPKEITEYKEKILFGMSIRQLICFSAAIVLAVGSYLLLTKVFYLSMDAASYVIIIESIPLMAIGFVKKNGFPFEKYFALFLRHKTGRNKLLYQTELLIDKVPDPNKESERKSKYAWIFEKEEAAGNGGPKPTRKEQKRNNSARECEVFTVTKASRKAKSKAAIRKIKKARQDYRATKRRIAKEAKKGSGPQIGTTAN